MNRAHAFGLLLLIGAGCQSTSERMPVKPLPEQVQALPYAELLTRARAQASAATEAFYLDRWQDLEEHARGLEQTARYIAKATEVPERQRSRLPTLSEELLKEAQNLREGLGRKDEKLTNEALQRVNLKVRELRLDY